MEDRGKLLPIGRGAVALQWWCGGGGAVVVLWPGFPEAGQVNQRLLLYVSFATSVQCSWCGAGRRWEVP